MRRIDFDLVPNSHLPLATLNTGDMTHLTWEETKYGSPAVVAHRDGEVLGLLVYSRRNRFMWLCLAWVHPDFRKRGLALQMFAIAAAHHRPRTVAAEAVTKGGRAFMTAIARSFEGRVRVMSWNKSPMNPARSPRRGGARARAAATAALAAPTAAQADVPVAAASR